MTMSAATHGHVWHYFTDDHLYPVQMDNTIP